MAENLQNSAGFRLAIVVEGGLAIVALILAWVFRIELREQLPRTWAEAGLSTARGLIATLPMLLGFWWLVRTTTTSLARLRRTVQEMIREIFPASSLPQLALVSVLAGVSEELLFRGVLQTMVANWSTPLVGLAVASIVFGALHALTRLYFVLATVVGAYLGGMLWQFDDLLVPIVAHSFYDFVALVYLTRAKPPE
jgi:hypothetical protein